MKASLFRVGDDVEIWRMLLYFTLLAIALLLVERALHALEQCTKKYPKYHEMINKTYRELMVLGLIGLSIKILKEANVLDEASPGMLAFMCADLTIFIMAIALILQAISIFVQWRMKNKEIDTLELLTAEELYTIATQHELSRQNPVVKWWFRGKYDELVTMRILRHLFLRLHQLPELFPFAKYLRQAQDNQISHMIDIEVSTWLLLFFVSWLWYVTIKTLTDSGLLEFEAQEERHVAIALVFFVFTWMLVFFHMVTAYCLEKCMDRLLLCDGSTATRMQRLNHLREIAIDESIQLSQEVTSDAIKRMQQVQEDQQIKRHKRRHAFVQHDTGFQLIATIYRKLCGQKPALPTHEEAAGVRTQLHIKGFSRKAWHCGIKILLILNALYVALFVESMVHLLPKFVVDFGLLPAILVPTPLFFNACYLQAQILRSFVLISSICRVDVESLSNVIEHFTDTVEWQTKFIVSVHQCLVDREQSVDALLDLFIAKDPSASGCMDVEEMRQVLASIGFEMSFFRFNSVMKLLFELQHGRVEYDKVITLLRLADDATPLMDDGEFDGPVLAEEPSGTGSVPDQGQHQVHVQYQIPLQPLERLSDRPVARRVSLQDPLSRSSKFTRQLIMRQSSTASSFRVRRASQRPTNGTLPPISISYLSPYDLQPSQHTPPASLRYMRM